jgi:hypothetical protein
MNRSHHVFYPKVGHQISGFFPTPDQNFTCFHRPPSETCVQTELGHKLGGSRPWFGKNIGEGGRNSPNLLTLWVTLIKRISISLGIFIPVHMHRRDVWYTNKLY